MEIYIPKPIAHYEPELRFFMDAMVRKLHTNRHKGFAENVSLKQLLTQLRKETRELRDALNDEGQFALFMECVDVANQAWLLGLAATRMTRIDYDKETTNAVGEK